MTIEEFNKFLDFIISYNVTHIQFINFNFHFVVPSKYKDIILWNYLDLYSNKSQVSISFDARNWHHFNGFYLFDIDTIYKICKLRIFS